MTTICQVCGKVCKNQRGLRIHEGHMHKKLSEVQELRQEVKALRIELRDFIAKSKQLNQQDMWIPLGQNTPTIKLSLGQNYGVLHQDLMHELRSRFQGGDSIQ